MLGVTQIIDLRRSRGLIVPKKVADYLEYKPHDQLFLQALEGVLYIKKLEVVTRGIVEGKPKTEDLEKQKGLKNGVKNWEGVIKAQSEIKNAAETRED